MHSGALLYRNCYDRFDAEVARKGYFFTNVHCEGPNTPQDVPNPRIFMDRSWLTTFSTFCTRGDLLHRTRDAGDAPRQAHRHPAAARRQ